MEARLAGPQNTQGTLWFPDDLEVVGEPARAQCHPLPDDLLLLSELGRAEATAIRHLERSNERLLEELQFAEDNDSAKMLRRTWACFSKSTQT